ncbi:SIMPL domain-containing protein [Flavobacterium sp. N1719]|uniref:SIMPL domain-containing protein n=1 Tax=Flavobacterium sp. N1719 TaxID=2885633 RepID=UPI002222666C|nr:SIMPL domain-containing protein [Flavobacterium sp. N1719]
MKKLVFALCVATVSLLQAQESKIEPQITVSGQGKVKVAPDYAVITFGVENTGKDVAEVKKSNDEAVDKVIKFLKKFGIAGTEYQTSDVSLGRNYDESKKKYAYQASQTLTVTLRDLSKYDELTMGLLDNGINSISGVEFKSTKIEELRSQARKLATQDALKRAQDYVAPLNQKVGKAITINETGGEFFPMLKTTNGFANFSADAPQETLAIGLIEVSSSITISFRLE